MVRTNSRSSGAAVTVTLIAFLFFFTGLAVAQDYRGKVQGLVTDSSQAAVVGAKVTLRNVGTGAEASKTTEATGRYLFDFVTPGTYSVTVSNASVVSSCGTRPIIARVLR